MKKNFQRSLQLALICLCIGFFYACSSQKDTATNRAMQNLSARYNYIYNSNLILDNYIADLHDTYADNYAEILPVYIAPQKFNAGSADPVAPPVDSKALDAIIFKAQTIIADKSYSNYIDEAYMLLGKAHYFKGNYFVAAEYFDYTAKAYRSNPNVFIQALNWKTRSYLQLNDMKTSASILDTMEAFLPGIKKNRAEPLATMGQMGININRNKEAITYLEAAVKSSSNSRNTIRWTYILAQLYDQQKNLEQALRYYTNVQKSNAGFELYFNANLNRIRLNALMNGQKINRKQQLLALLRDDKNSDYIDQIYYQIGEFFSESESYTEASGYYNRSVQASTKNPYQKGLSYLKLADLNFKYFKDYLKAKIYYDSTVAVLPKTYPGYDLILKKDQNLEYLTKRYEQITLQDTLQALAKLTEADRLTRVELMLTPAAVAVPAASTAGANFAPDPAFPATNLSGTAPQASGSTFYFSNATALGKGLSDFRKKWGNRKLEDNWRQSIRVAVQTNTQNTLNPGNAGLALNPDDAAPGTVNNKSQIDAYMASIPVNAALLSNSNQKTIDAYFEIAGFYQQELNDQDEAIRVYEELLRRFPDNKYLAAINYSLFLAYKNKDAEKAAVYRNVVLSQYGSSVYAKTILDPSFSIKQNEFDAIVNKKYNDLFDIYAAKDFAKVIVEADRLIAEYPNNFLAPQFAYLRAIAIGRTSYVDSLVAAFNQIKTAFPTDLLIVPLVNENLAYISHHMAEFKQRKIALLDFDPNEPRFMGQLPQQAVAATQKPAQPAVKPTAVIVQEPQQPATKMIPGATKATITEPAGVKPAEINPVAAKPVIKKDNVFNTAASTTWYYVIDVSDASLTLSSSRFGIGQFNRGNYPDDNLRHQLMEFDDDQLIYVGNFSNFEDVKNYAAGITPQLKQIMKVPETIYTPFIISKENFDKLKSRALVIQYLEFYKNNYSNE